MLFYPARWPDVTTSGADEAAALSLPGQAGLVAVRAADLASPAGPGLGKDGRPALVAAGAGKIRTGGVVVFLKPGAVGAAGGRRDRRVRVGAGIAAEHREHDFGGVMVGALDVCGSEGSLPRVPDPPANRGAFGSAGTADDSSPYPQLRELRCSDASTRAALAVTSGPSGAAAGGGRDKGEAEQVLLDKALTDYPQVFTPARIWIMDRNFPGPPRISTMLPTDTHILIRVKDGITLNRTGGFAPDGSYLASISGGGGTLAVPVIQYTISVAGADAPELFAPIPLLPPDYAYPAPLH